MDRTDSQINFDEIVEMYFWDTEFLVVPERDRFLLTEEATESSRQENEINLAQGLHPHPDLLAVSQVHDPAWIIIDEHDDFMPGSRLYPDRGL